jgi:cyclophilin family peptidyl-prolyl cis-trans isomerase
MKLLSKIILSALFLCLTQTSCAETVSKKEADKKQTAKQEVKQQEKETKILFETSEGNIIVKLYNETPQHRDNFVKLVKEGFYNNVLFHRVIPNFMIQTGDPDSKTAVPGQNLGTGGPGYTIPAEFIYPKYFHKKGALAAARTSDQINPEKASSGSQFYIVTGNILADIQLDQMESGKRGQKDQALFQQKAMANMELIRKLQAENDQAGLEQLENSIIAEIEKETANEPAFKFTEEQRNAYKTIGGAPFLDNEYTVFGEVVEGLDVVDKISATQTGSQDRPVNDIKIIRATIVK